ncbi:MAG TPA: DUF4123 domain-containing protein [Bryobacteraceae bacterium]|jgi:hypothetical protein
MTSQWLKQIESYLWPGGFSRDVWMIVDGARDRRIFWMLRELHLEHYCLYAGPLSPALEAAAPYLVQLDHNDEETHRFLRNAWGNSWGVFLECDAHRNTLRQHLRGFLTVRDPAGNRLVFRYYDPRVLRIYLPICNEEELARIFGPIGCFWTEGKAAGNMLEFQFSRGYLLQRTLSLETGTLVPSAIPALSRDTAPRPDASPRQGLLTIRHEQMAAFSRVEVEKFEAGMLTHLVRFFPKECAALKEAQLRDLIQYGIERARAHEITSERDVTKYIDLMLVFGRDFDTDKRYPWASYLLANRKTARSKIRSLSEAAEGHLRQV